MLVDSIPKDSEALINLLTIKTDNDLKNVDEFHKMTEIRFMSSFYILHAAITFSVTPSQLRTSFLIISVSDKIFHSLKIVDFKYRICFFFKG